MAIETADDPQAAAKLAESLKIVIGKMEREAADRVGKRQLMERRWIEDLEQYHGKYDSDTLKKLNEGEKSKLFINLTRPKTDAMEARLTDLLFPTDDKNWGIQPTPVPELTDAAKAAVEQAEAAAEQAQQAQEQAAVAQEAGQPVDQTGLQAAQQQADDADATARQLRAVIDEARKRADNMAHEIEDQLKQSDYHAAMRDVIADACKIGTGVCKGPVTGDRVRKGWKKTQRLGEDGQPVEEYQLQIAAGDQPAMRHVDIWSFFPDMDARNIHEGQGVYIRHLMNPKKLRETARLPGFDKDAIRRLLKEKARSSAPAYLTDLRNLSGDNQQVANDLYHVWEYSGPIDAEDMRDLALSFGDAAALDDLAEIDPLSEVNAIVWFCQDELLKFAIYPFDSGECMYSVFSLAKDEASVFGYGIPSIMRDPQASLNASWRAMMDNAGLASGPQIVVATDLVEPADGDWTMRPRKVWRALAGLPRDRRAFETFDIPMRQAEMGNIIAISKQFIDDMTAMPQIAQGEQGAGVTKTAQGMALLMNSANVVFRRIVKNFDDDVTVPNIRRLYDWNMQFNPKEGIKGDFEVDARGSSVLLVREMQAQNLMMVAIQLGAHPVYGPMLRNRNVLRKLFQAQMIPSDEVMLTDDEIEATMAAAAAEAEAAAQQQPVGKTPEEIELERERIELDRDKMEADIERANMDNDTKRYVADVNRETALIKMAETMNMNIDKLEAMLTNSREERQSKERVVATEVAVEARNAAAAKAAGVTPGGSGGYISAGGAKAVEPA